jgi:hypothetical protein
MNVELLAGLIIGELQSEIRVDKEHNKITIGNTIEIQNISSEKKIKLVIRDNVQKIYDSNDPQLPKQLLGEIINVKGL